MIHHSHRYFKPLLKLLVSVGLIVFLFSKLDEKRLLNSLLNLDAKAVFACLIVLMLLIALQGVRWCTVAHGLSISIGLNESIALSFIGAFFNQVLPSSVGGDTIRVYRLYRSGFPLGLSFNSILIDRVLGIVGLIVLSAIGFGMLGWTDLPTRLIVALGVFAAAIIAGIVVLLSLDHVPLLSVIARLAIIHKIKHMSANARHIFLNPFILFITITSSILAHLGTSGVFWLIGRQVGLQADFLVCVAIVPLATLATIIPISFGGWGVREGAVVLAFSSIGGNATVAMLVSILFGIATACASLPGILFWLKDPKKPQLKERELEFATPMRRLNDQGDSIM